MKEHVSEFRQAIATQLRSVLGERAISAVFQPIYGFHEGEIVGHEALVRGPVGTALESPEELFRAARAEGLSAELGVVCIREVLRAFARHNPPGLLFLNVSPQLIQSSGFEQARGRRFLEALGLAAERIVIELTEDYPTIDFAIVRESLLLYRAMGLRVAIDDLGEGFASLRLWSELRPEFVKADRHFVSGIAEDPVKLQFLHSIQQIAVSCGSRVIAEGVENADDFRVAREIGIAYAQGWFVGWPSPQPATGLAPSLALAREDVRPPVIPVARGHRVRERTAGDFLRAVDVATPAQTMGELCGRFAHDPLLCAIPVAGTGGVAGVVSRPAVMPVAGSESLDEPCARYLETLPLRVEADLDLPALAALLAESDARRVADGFVIVSRGRYLGMGTSADVLRAMAEANVAARRHTSPLTELPGQVPINEQLERLLARQVAFCACFLEIEDMRGLNDEAGFERGDELIRQVARRIEAQVQPHLDLVGHVAGSRFVALVQSEDAIERIGRVIPAFEGTLDGIIEPAVRARGYFISVDREGGERVRPLPRLAAGILPVLPGVHESRHEVLSLAKRACREAKSRPGSGLHVDHHHGNAYPPSLLFSED
jgi:EAL domain-containing protein (putative c-di-GMP-specific phosphodiesterase class I)/GGDEF domain-containing protein